MDNKTYKQLIHLIPDVKDTNSLIYYFDGDCSMCIGKVKYIETKELPKKALKLIFIARTQNPALLEFNTKSLSIKSSIYIEKHNEFAQVLKFDGIIELNRDKIIVPNAYNTPGGFNN
jgi:predicted DCC family thiol-disulfide oxidoreductase YuxK